MQALHVPLFLSVSLLEQSSAIDMLSGDKSTICHSWEPGVQMGDPQKASSPKLLGKAGTQQQAGTDWLILAML